MNSDFWINIVKHSWYYYVEIWSINEDRIAFVEKKKALTMWRAKRMSKNIVLRHIVKQYIHDKS